jgi:hypothetical protein
MKLERQNQEHGAAFLYSVITRIQENENYGFPKQSQQAEDK